MSGKSGQAQSFTLIGFKDDSGNTARIDCEDTAKISNELLSRRIEKPDDEYLLDLVRNRKNYLQGASVYDLPETPLHVILDGNNPALHPSYMTRAQELEERIGTAYDIYASDVAARPRGEGRDNALAYQAEIFCNMPIHLHTDARRAQLQQRLPELHSDPARARFNQALTLEKIQRTHSTPERSQSNSRA